MDRKEKKIMGLTTSAHALVHFYEGVLPPLIPDFAPADRPASSLGDPQAPVVIYEWSDYT